MERYKAVFKEDVIEGMYAVGLVEDPAMQDMLVHLKEEEIKLSTIDEKRMIFGAVIIPNKDILRVDGEGKPYTMSFSEETVEQLAHNWIEKGAHRNFSEQHETPIQGVVAVEMWTVKDPDRDTSNFYGKKYEKGTLVALSKVNNEKTWQDIKSGKINGYSIEAVLGLEKITPNTSINLKSEIEMNEDTKKSIVNDVIDGIKALFNSQKEEVQEVETVSEEVEAKANEAEVVEESPTIDIEALKKELTETLGVEFKSHVETIKAELSKQVEDKDAEIDELKAELSKQPEVASIKSNPEGKVSKSYEEMTNFEKMMYNRDNKF